MNKILKTLAITLTILACTFTAEAKKIKVLTIGNSFAHSLNSYLPLVAKSVPDCELILGNANRPGCSLQEHWTNIEREEQNENAKSYGKKMGTPHVYKLRDILKSEKWDIISIQQASHFSWREETFQPYADKLIGYIRNFAPEAEIVIQQTWSYRLDAPLFEKWAINQNIMFEKLDENYKALAKHKKLRVIPMGLAVQLGRKEQAETCLPYTKETLKNLRYPDLPSRVNMLVGNIQWRKGTDGEMHLRQDFIHLSPRGEYMQACLWFAFLFDKKTSEITYVPSSIADSDARWIQKKAQEALDSFVQIKK